MSDIYPVKKRSEIMSLVQHKGTYPERLVFAYLRKQQIYCQHNYSRAPGSPDVALPRKKRAVFIEGDFWHGCDFEREKDKLPQFWLDKIIRNVRRDRRDRKLL